VLRALWRWGLVVGLVLWLTAGDLYLLTGKAAPGAGGRPYEPRLVGPAIPSPLPPPPTLARSSAPSSTWASLRAAEGTRRASPAAPLRRICARRAATATASAAAATAAW